MRRVRHAHHVLHAAVVTGLATIRFFIGVLSACFVPCQAWCSQLFAKEIVATANAMAGGWGNLGGGAVQLLMLGVWNMFRTGFDTRRPGAFLSSSPQCASATASMTSTSSSPWCLLSLRARLSRHWYALGSLGNCSNGEAATGAKMTFQNSSQVFAGEADAEVRAQHNFFRRTWRELSHQISST